MGIVGTVANSSRGVEIVAQGRKVQEFIARLKAKPPPLSRIVSLSFRVTRSRTFKSFRIIPSRPGADAGAEVLPDIATCPACRRELHDPEDRRFRYPFTNCTQCGPRYTIVESLPYDRPRTTMRAFEMCPDCRREYDDPTNRRFHAQPNACPACGPTIRLLGPEGELLPGHPIDRASRAIAAGKVVAIKSLGGFQLACDATCDKTVRKLRRRKNRPAKPLAVMCDSTAVASRFCRVSRAGRALLNSAAAPIVLLPKKSYPELHVSSLVAPGNGRIGVMLPYTPLHFVLLEGIKQQTGKAPVLVLTSANRKDEPITATVSELRTDLSGTYDIVLTHDRPIANRCDDSVVLEGQTSVLVRRARGYAPQPVLLSPMFHVKQPTLALGAGLRNCFALAQDNRVFLSPHIGDLASPGAERFLLETLDRYIDWTGIAPRRIACDLHPDYPSTRLAEHLSRKRKLPLYRIQHHLAHIASVMAEHGIPGPVLGLAFDGTGYGPDATIWGCEFLLVNADFSWQRVGHLKTLDLIEPGHAVADPAKLAAAFLLHSGRKVPRGSHLARHLAAVKASLKTGHGIPSSSLGRLFDAVAAITGVSRDTSFEGAAPIALESASLPGEPGHYMDGQLVNLKNEPVLINPEPIICRVLDDLLASVEPGVVAARFQNTIVRAAVTAANHLARLHGTHTVLLSGGSFQNGRLRQGVTSALNRHGFLVACNQLVPVNDGGVALGQVVAAGTD